MPEQKDDGMLWLIGIAALALGAWWWQSDDDEVVDAPPPSPPLAPPQAAETRPPYDILITRLESGTDWMLDVDSVKGPRESRIAWVRELHLKDKTTQHRETKTLYELNCDRDSYFVRSSISYDKEGSVSARHRVDAGQTNPLFAPPDSNIAGLFEEACKAGFDEPPK